MKITLFTSNSARHISLINRLASIADKVFVVQEGKTIFPGQVDDFFKKTPIMQDYFQRVIAAEERVFGDVQFTAPNAQVLGLKLGDLNKVPLTTLAPALQSDVYVVFGASFIKGELCRFLVDHQCYNIHMGVSPFYRGNSCNFWASYDARYDLVGATIHLLTKGLDSGPMLFHALPSPDIHEPFLLSMASVYAAHSGLLSHIQEGTISKMEHISQNKQQELRYTRLSDFTDEVAARFLDQEVSPESVRDRLAHRDKSFFVNPFIDVATF